MTRDSDWRVAIIGAGVAGASAGQALAKQGACVSIFDKGRGPGGRCATRRHDVCAFDHGAQYFTARDPGFRRQVAAWTRSGAASAWRPRIGELSGAYFKPTQRKDLWVGTPGMNALSSAMLDSLHVRFESQVRTIERTADRWAVIEASGDRHAGFDQLLITVPAPQVGPILGQYFPDASDTAARATMMPCWTLMVAFKKRIDLSFDAAKVTGDGPIGWLARNSSKPGRLDNGMDCWVVQAGHGWSRDHVERSPQEAADALLSDFTRVCRESSISIAPLTHLAVHRWRYALAMPGDTPHFVIHADTGLAVAGDWLAGGRIEKAWLSGLAAAEALTLNRLEKKPTIVGASHK